RAQDVLPLLTRLAHVMVRAAARLTPAMGEAVGLFLQVLAPQLERRLQMLDRGLQARAQLVAERRRRRGDLRLDAAQLRLQSRALDLRRRRRAELGGQPQRAERTN